MNSIEKTDHLYEVHSLAIEAEGQRCPECHDVGSKGQLFRFWTVRGNKTRIHDGAFCSQQCHDRWHGVAPRGGDHV